MTRPLVVVSAVKKTIKELGGCNTAQETIDLLNSVILENLKSAIESAKKDGRKTVMRRDFPG
jgi:histone H3/H4